MLECILFDLDNTLYPKSLGIFDRVVERIRGYMEIRMGFERGLAQRLRREYIREYGSTMRGLMIHHRLDPREFLDYVHDVGVEQSLGLNPALGELLRSIPCQKAIFTSGHLPHAQRVLRCMGVEEHFPRIFDITFTRFIPKPNLEPYHQVLEVLGVEGSGCMMIEDMAANLKPAKDLGMTTVLIGSGADGFDGAVDYAIDDILELRGVLPRAGVRL